MERSRSPYRLSTRRRRSGSSEVKQITNLPDAVVGATVAAVVAALGYVGRLLVQGWMAWRRARAQRLARLLELYALLRATKVAFRVQRELAGRLAERLRLEHPNHVPQRPGLERLFAELHGQFGPEEADLHRVIRSYTEHALRPLNDAMLTWLRSDFDFRTAGSKTGPQGHVAVKLAQLEAHLLLWLAKYEAWIVGRPEHALVYLADEEEHGLGFPRGIDETMAAFLAHQGRVVELVANR